MRIEKVLDVDAMISIILSQTQEANDSEDFYIKIPLTIADDIVDVLSEVRREEAADDIFDPSMTAYIQEDEKNDEGSESHICFGEDAEQCKKCACFFENKVPDENEKSIYSKSMGYVDRRRICEDDVWKKFYICLKLHGSDLKSKLSITEYAKEAIRLLDLRGSGIERLKDVLNEKIDIASLSENCTENEVLNFAVDAISKLAEVKTKNKEEADEKAAVFQLLLAQERDKLKSAFDKTVWTLPENLCESCYYRNKNCSSQCSTDRRPVCFKRYRLLCSTLCDFCIHREECKSETESKVLSEE